MEPSNKKNTNGKYAKAFKAELYSNLEKGDARVNLERRKLISRIERESGEVQPIRRLQQRSYRLALGAMVTAATACFLAVLIVYSNSHSEISGFIELKEEGHSIARLTTSGDQGAKVELADKTTLWFEPGARFKIDNQQTIKLESGRLLAKVAPRKHRELRVVTAQVTVVVNGTVFSVRADERNSIVKLHEGEISLLAGRNKMIVRSGQQVSVSNNGSMKVIEMRETDVKEDLQITSKTGRLNGAKVPPLNTLYKKADSLEATPKKIEVKAEPSKPRVADVVAVNEPDKKNDNPPKPSINRPGNDLRATETKSDDFEQMDTLTLLPRVQKAYRQKKYKEVLALTKDNSSDAKILMLRAKALEMLGRWNEAANEFVVVARISIAHRAEAYYLTSSVLFKDGNYGGALDYANESLRAAGPTSEKAGYLKLRTLMEMERFAEAAEAADDYLTNHPNGPMAEDALYYRGLCLSRSGKRAEGRRFLKEYLDNFPEGRYWQRVQDLLGDR